MEDRVGDVLAQRAALERGTGTAIALSLILHIALTGVAAWSALRQPKDPVAPGISIKFAPMPSAPATRKSRSTQAKKPAAVKPAPPVAEPAPRIEAPRPEPVKTTAPPEKNTVALNNFGRSTKKGSESPATAPPRPSVPATPASGPELASGTQDAADVPVGGAGVTGLEGGDFPYTMYIERMRTLIGNRWLRPQVAAGTTSTVYFEIQRDGTIRDPEVKTRSGNSSFDRAALRAVMEASPLPPLPFGYNGTYLGVHLTFK